MIRKHKYPTNKLQQYTNQMIITGCSANIPQTQSWNIQYRLQSGSVYFYSLTPILSYILIFLSTCREQRTNYSNTNDMSSKTRCSDLHVLLISTAIRFPFVVLSHLWKLSWENGKLLEGSADTCFGKRLCRLISIILQAGTWARGWLIRLNLIFVPCCHFSIPQTVWLSKWLTGWFLW